MTNQLMKVADQMRDLPHQEMLQKQLNQLQKIGDDIRICLEEVSNAKQQALALRAVEHSATIDDILDTQLSIVKQRAEALLSLIAAKQVPENAKVSAPLQDVTTAAATLRQSISKEWADISSNEQEKARAFLDLALRYDDAAARTLKTAMERFAKLIKSPPTSKAEIDVYRAARVELTAARDALRLEGATGSFLLSCLKGEGDPRELQNRELQEFLRSHPALWKRLRVVLV